MLLNENSLSPGDVLKLDWIKGIHDFLLIRKVDFIYLRSVGIRIPSKVELLPKQIQLLIWSHHLQLLLKGISVEVCALRLILFGALLLVCCEQRYRSRSLLFRSSGARIINLFVVGLLEQLLDLGIEELSHLVIDLLALSFALVKCHELHLRIHLLLLQ